MVTIDGRYCGPPGSANGGYACGVVAEAVPDGPGLVEVTLRTPPPLDHELSVQQRDGVTVLLDGETLVGEARRVSQPIESPEPVSLSAASVAAEAFPWATDHPYPGCFVCGPDRAHGDGLRIFPGPLADRPLAAAPWTPDDSVVSANGRVSPRVIWAALDCPSWFGLACFETWEGRPLLGRLAVEILGCPQPGDACVCVGWLDERSGRKALTGSAVYSSAGELLGRARATWITVPF